MSLPLTQGIYDMSVCIWPSIYRHWVKCLSVTVKYDDFCGFVRSQIKIIKFNEFREYTLTNGQPNCRTLNFLQSRTVKCDRALTKIHNKNIFFSHLLPFRISPSFLFDVASIRRQVNIHMKYLVPLSLHRNDDFLTQQGILLRRGKFLLSCSPKSSFWTSQLLKM